MKATTKNNSNLNDNDLRLVPYKMIVKSKKEQKEFEMLQASCDKLNYKLALIQVDYTLSKKERDKRIDKLMCEYLDLFTNKIKRPAINQLERRINELERRANEL